MAARDGLISWLHAISGHYILTGQTAHSNGDKIDYNTAVLGFPLAIEFYDPWLSLQSAAFDDTFFDRSLAALSAGSMVGISLMMPGPLGGLVGSLDGVDAAQVLTWGTPQNLALQANLYRVGSLLWRYKNATSKPIYLRPFMEPDGWWFWWGASTFTPPQSVALYRFAWWYLTQACQLDNIVFQWAVNGGPDSFVDRYPGGDVVDMVGLEAYTNDIETDCLGTYHTLRALAPDKLIALTERGSGTPGGADHSFDERLLYAALRRSMPSIVLVNYWSGWEPSRDQHAVEALQQPFVLNRP